MSVSLRCAEDSSCICLEGAIDISCAAELKSALLAAVARAGTVRISFGNISGMDITSFQLLWAARRQAVRTQARLAPEGRLPEAACRSFANAGLDGTGILP